MVISEDTIKELEKRQLLPDDLKRYLLAKYSQEPFPYEYSEQDLYESIERDLRGYEAKTLDVTLRSPPERWQDERKYLQNLYAEKAFEVRQLEDYVLELEEMLLVHEDESPRMAKRRLDARDPTAF